MQRSVRCPNLVLMHSLPDVANECSDSHYWPTSISHMCMCFGCSILRLQAVNCAFSHINTVWWIDTSYSFNAPPLYQILVLSKPDVPGQYFRTIQRYITTKINQYSRDINRREQCRLALKMWSFDIANGRSVRRLLAVSCLPCEHISLHTCKNMNADINMRRLMRIYRSGSYSWCSSSASGWTLV